jgi:hypothetical protein
MTGPRTGSAEVGTGNRRPRASRTDHRAIHVSTLWDHDQRDGRRRTVEVGSRFFTGNAQIPVDPG